MNILCCLCLDVNEIGANHFQIDVRNDIHSIRPAARDVRICRRDKRDGVSAEAVSLQSAAPTCEAFRDAPATKICGVFQDITQRPKSEAPYTQRLHLKKSVNLSLSHDRSRTSRNFWPNSTASDPGFLRRIES